MHRYYFRYVDAPERWRDLLPALRWNNRFQSRMHLHLTYGPRVGTRAHVTPFSFRRACYVGAQWTNLRRACAKFVADSVRDQPELAEHYRACVVPDESYAQTVLLGEGRFQLLNDNFRFVDHDDRSGGSPRTIVADDLQRLASGRFDFARKFSGDDDLLLDRIDRELLALDRATGSTRNSMP